MAVGVGVEVMADVGAVNIQQRVDVGRCGRGGRLSDVGRGYQNASTAAFPHV
jgi:hypothetical protein